MKLYLITMYLLILALGAVLSREGLPVEDVFAAILVACLLALIPVVIAGRGR